MPGRQANTCFTLTAAFSSKSLARQVWHGRGNSTPDFNAVLPHPSVRSDPGVSPSRRSISRKAAAADASRDDDRLAASRSPFASRARPANSSRTGHGLACWISPRSTSSEGCDGRRRLGCGAASPSSRLLRACRLRRPEPLPDAPPESSPARRDAVAGPETMRFASVALLALGAVPWGVAASGDQKSDPTRENTYFDGKKVPPILELTPDNFKAESKASKWLLVKHYRYGTAPRRGHPSDADAVQPVLPPLHRFRPDVPDPVRVLLHVQARRTRGRRLHRLLRLPLRDAQLRRLLRPLHRPQGHVVPDDHAVQGRRGGGDAARR